MNKKKELMMYASSILLGVIALGLISASKTPIFLKAEPTVHKIIINQDNPLTHTEGEPYYPRLDPDFVEFYHAGQTDVRTVEGSTRTFDFLGFKHVGDRMAMHYQFAETAYLANRERIGSLLTLKLSGVELYEDCSTANLEVWWGWNYATPDVFANAYGEVSADTNIYPGRELASLTASADSLTFNFGNDKPTYFYLVLTDSSSSISFAEIEITYRDDLGGCEPSAPVVPQIIDNNLLYIQSGAGLALYGTMENMEIVNLIVPNTVDGLVVNAVHAYAFDNSPTLKTVTLPAGVKTIENSAFQNCPLLETVVMPGVETISNASFSNCPSLKGLNLLPATLAKICSNAFERCTGLETIHIPANVTSIEYGAFRDAHLNTITVDASNTIYDSRNNCNAIINTSTNYLIKGSNSAFIPDTVVQIDNSAFRNCQTLAAINIPASVERISYGAFENCLALTNVTFTLPSSLSSMESQVFANCSSLTAIALPDSISYWGLGSSTFSGCTSLQTVKLPSAVTNIPYATFNGCRSLTSLTYNSDILQGIYQFAFADCISLTSIHIPANVTYIDANSFRGIGDYLTAITVDPTNTTFNDGGGSNAIIKTATNSLIFGCNDTVIPSTVVEIGWNAFYGCSGITSLNLPSGLKRIQSSAFANCTSLSSATLPLGLELIESAVFENCTSLSSISIPSGVTNAKHRLFSGCTSLSNVTLSPNTTEIDSEVFEGCTSLTQVNIPDGVVRIGYEAFSDTAITAIHIPASVEEIDLDAFMHGGAHLQTITVASGNPNYHDNNGGNCLIWNDMNVLLLGTPTANLPADLMMMYMGAFQQPNLTTFELPAGVALIFPGAFTNCQNLTSLTVHPDNPYFDSRDNCNGIIETATNSLVYGNSHTVLPAGVNVGMGAYAFNKDITAYTLPTGTVAIGSGTFFGCTALSAFTIPNTVTYLGDMCFSETAITTLVIPRSVNSIGYSIVYDCPNLTDIFVERAFKPFAWRYDWAEGHEQTIRWYSETPIYDGHHWHYVAGVPTVWVE